MSQGKYVTMEEIPETEVMRWLALLLEPEFRDKNIIMSQIQNAKLYLKESYVDACFFGFKTVGDVEKYPYKITVPIEMSIYRKNGIPIDFLLFLSEGVVSEMEIADYDFLNLDPVSFDFTKRDYRVNDAVKI